MRLHSLGLLPLFYTLMSLGALHDTMRLDDASQSNSFPSLAVPASEIKWEYIHLCFLRQGLST